MRFVTWLLTYAVGLAVAAQLLDGIRFDGPAAGQAEVQEKLVPLLVVALILGLVSTFVEPVIKLLSLPFIILTLGFHVGGFWNALVGAIIVTIVGWGVRAALPARD